MATSGMEPRRGLFPRPRRSASRATSAAQTSGGGLLELATLSGAAALETRAVTLSEDETHVCARVAQLLLHETTRAYEAQLGQQPHVDPRQWKLVRKKDQLCAYKQRKEAARASALGETTQPLLLVTGTLAGRLDDVMLGLVSADTRAMRLHAAYAQDALEDAHVLAALQRPSVEQPFRFLGLKWAVRRHDSSSAASFLKRRDALYLEATGTSTLSDGQRVGFRVLHSLGVKALAQLSATSTSAAVVRARLSICQLFHEQQDASNTATLRVFSRGYYDPRGGMMQFVALNVAAELLLHLAASPVDCAHLKKLAFAAQQAARTRRAATRRRKASAWGRGVAGARRKSMDGIAEWDGEHGDAGLADGLAAPASPSGCAVCSRRLGSVLGRATSCCAVCSQAVCSRCSVVKKLHVSRARAASADGDVRGEETNPLAGSMGLHDVEHLSGHEAASRASTERSRSSSRSRSRSGSGAHDVSQQPCKLCLPCVMRATQRSAAQLAVEELLENLTAEPSPRGPANARSTWDCPPSHRAAPRAGPTRRRSTQTGRAYSSHGPPPFLSPSPYVQEPHYAQTPHFQPRKKAFSTAPLPVPTSTAMRRASALATPVVLYVEDPVATPRSAA